MAREPVPGVTAHHHHDHTRLTTSTGTTLTGPPPIDFITTAPHITRNGQPVTDIDRLLEHIDTDTDAFAGHLRESIDNLADALAAATPHPHGTHLWTTAAAHHPNPGVYFEQLVATGHPIHPMARTRGGLTPRQVHAWAPEHRPLVPLILARPRTPTPAHGAWPWLDDDKTPLLPMHPYQADRYRDAVQPIATRPAAPLMSLRTLAPRHQPHLHVKTAVDLQMTSAIRRVSPAAIHNGPLLSRYLTRTHPDLAIHAETATMAVSDDEHPAHSLSAIVRTLPPATADTVPIPLAALAEPDPATTTPLAATIIDTTDTPPLTWWHDCVRLILTPPLTLARHGIALEAHGQNTLLELHRGNPHRLIYRDFGGVRIDPAITTPAGDLTEPNPRARHTTLIAALYSTVFRQLIHALSHHYREDPATWWQPVIEHSHRLTRHDRLLHDMVFNDTWPLKATTAMRLAADPLDNQWITIPNPIAAAR